jgi:hypothetical protein
VAQVTEEYTILIDNFGGKMSLGESREFDYNIKTERKQII